MHEKNIARERKKKYRRLAVMQIKRKQSFEVIIRDKNFKLKCYLHWSLL